MCERNAPSRQRLWLLKQEQRKGEEASQVKGIFGPADRLAKVDGRAGSIPVLHLRAKTPPGLVVLPCLADSISSGVNFQAMSRTGMRFG
jgi:hypothetical protein